VPSEMEKQRAFAQGLRRPEFSFEPEFGEKDGFKMYGGDVRAAIPLGANTTLGLSAGASAGRGEQGMKMKPTPRGGITLKHEF
jgi:hypothetical protein